MSLHMKYRCLNVLLLSVLCMLAGLAKAETIDSLLHRSMPTEADIERNAVELIPKYYSKGAIDSAAMVVEAWQENCGADRIDRRIIVLMALLRGTYDDSLLDTTIFINVSHFQRYYGDKYLQNENNYNRRSPGRVWKDYQEFIVQLADSLVRTTDQTTSEYLLCLYYGGHFDEFYRQLQTNPAFEQSRLRKLYEQCIADIIRQTQGRMALNTGVWLPMGDAQRLGVHPSIGFLCGLKKYRYTGDLVLSFRLLGAHDSYEVKQADTVYATKHYFGGYIGLETGLEIIRTKSHEVDLYAGVAWDGFDAITKEQSAKNEAKSINAININPGIEYRYYYDHFRIKYFGGRIRYNIVDYNRDNDLITNLSGGSIALELLWGASGNRNANEELRALRHY